jgi:hypothetical protein
MKKLDTKKKKTESEILSDLLKITADAEQNLSMIDGIREFGIDMAKDHMIEGDYESAYMNLGDAVHYDYLKENLKEIKKILEEDMLRRVGDRNSMINSLSQLGKKKLPEELN